MPSPSSTSLLSTEKSSHSLQTSENYPCSPGGIRVLILPVLPHKQIELRLHAALRAVLPDADVSAVLVRPCPDLKFGDYQTNALMSVAKVRRMNPRQLAADVLARLDVSVWCEPVQIAGAGFLNFRLLPEALSRTLAGVVQSGHLFFEQATRPQTVVVDFSSPNVAKPIFSISRLSSTGWSASFLSTAAWSLALVMEGGFDYLPHKVARSKRCVVSKISRNSRRYFITFLTGECLLMMHKKN